MDDIRIQLPEARTLYVGRQRLVIRKPNVAWWITTVKYLAEVRAGLGIAEKREDLRSGIMAAIMKGSGRKLLLHFADTITPWPRWINRPLVVRWITRQDPQTIAKIVDAWIETVNVEEIKKSFRLAGERIGMTARATSPGSPASSK